MSFLLILCAIITVAIVVVLYAATHKLIQDHKELHSVNTDDDLDLPKTL
jgi:hypothetical protein